MRYFAIFGIFALAFTLAAPAAEAGKDYNSSKSNTFGIGIADEATDNADNRNVDSFFDIWTEISLDGGTAIDGAGLGDALRAEYQEGGVNDKAPHALDAFIGATTKSLKKGNRVALVGFGSFSVSTHGARTGRNPQTGGTIQIPAKKVVKFKAGKDLSETVKWFSDTKGYSVIIGGDGDDTVESERGTVPTEIVALNLRSVSGRDATPEVLVLTLEVNRIEDAGIPDDPAGDSVVDDGSKDNNSIEGIVTADEATDNADNRNIDSFFDVWTEARRVNWYGFLRGNDSARFKAGKDLSEVVR